MRAVHKCTQTDSFANNESANNYLGGGLANLSGPFSSGHLSGWVPGGVEPIPQLSILGLYSATETDHHTGSPSPTRATALSDSMLAALLSKGLAGHRREGAL